MISDNTDDAYSLYLYAHVIIHVENLMKRKQDLYCLIIIVVKQ